MLGRRYPMFDKMMWGIALAMAIWAGIALIWVIFALSVAVYAIATA